MSKYISLKELALFLWVTPEEVERHTSRKRLVKSDLMWIAYSLSQERNTSFKGFDFNNIAAFYKLIDAVFPDRLGNRKGNSIIDKMMRKQERKNARAS